ncbi:hypothetical protein EDB89DRAFT_1908379 [Lactarius sanguifluus]|nr:hypothetical protein EDB89DRAFT_1908379 [Lactarius sanguifluus]
MYALAPHQFSSVVCQTSLAAAEATAGEEDGDGNNDDEVQIDMAGDVQPRRSRHNTKGKAPARANDDSGTMDTSEGSGDVEMGEVVDNQKTPKKFQLVKHVIVISPSSEERRTSTATKAAAKAIGRLPNPDFCGPCQSHNMSEIRKVPCNPPPMWAVPLKEAMKQAAKVKQETKTCKHSTTSIMEELPLTLEGVKDRLDSMEANLTVFQEAMESHMGALQDVLYNIDIMMCTLCMRNAITPSTLALHIPPIPLFVPAAPSPSPTAGPSSIASTISSTLSTGFDISQLSIAAPLACVASGSGAGNTHTPEPQVLQDPKPDPKPQVLLGLGHCLAHATEGIGPSHHSSYQIGVAFLYCSKLGLVILDSIDSKIDQLRDWLVLIALVDWSHVPITPSPSTYSLPSDHHSPDHSGLNYVSTQVLTQVVSFEEPLKCYSEQFFSDHSSSHCEI